MTMMPSFSRKPVCSSTSQLLVLTSFLISTLITVDTLDEFFNAHMNCEPYHKLFKVVQLLLVLSYFQASVKRGFSFNKELKLENLANQLLVAH